MAINVMNNLTLILLILSALCALIFPTNVQSTNSLSEKFGKCEKEFWYKDQSHYKKSLKSKCLKEKHHKEKRHRQYHTCHHDKKVINKKWRKYSECRCDAAFKDLKDYNDSKVLLCYQIVRFNKSTGNFVAQISTYKKKSDKNSYGVAVKYDHIKLFNKDNDKSWSKHKDNYHRSKKVSNSYCDEEDQYSIEDRFIRGKLSKGESMDKVSLNRVTPNEFSLINEENGKETTLKKNQGFVVLPFSKFLLNDDEDRKLEPDQNLQPGQPGQPDNNPKEDNDKPPSNGPDATEPAPDSGVPETIDNGYGTPDGDNNNKETDQQIQPNPNDQPQPSQAPVNPSVSSSNQESNTGNNDGKQDSGGFSAAGGGIAISVMISVGAAFIGYNTYERLKWRRHYRRRQAAATQQNPSLANVPDYNGYGRAY